MVINQFQIISLNSIGMNKVAIWDMIDWDMIYVIETETYRLVIFINILIYFYN